MYTQRFFHTEIKIFDTQYISITRTSLSEMCASFMFIQTMDKVKSPFLFCELEKLTEGKCQPHHENRIECLVFGVLYERQLKVWNKVVDTIFVV